MPRILNGQTTMGVGSTGVSVNNRLVVPGAGSSGWVSSTQLVCNGSDAGNAVLTFPPAGPFAPLWEPGADRCYAGGGTIAAGLTNVGTRLRNASTDFQTISTLVPLDVDRLTGIALLYDRQYGQDISICYPSNPGTGKFPILLTGPLYSARILGGVVCWAEGVPGGIQATGFNLNIGQAVPIDAWDTYVYQPLLLPNVRTTGDTWVAYTTQNGTLYLHPAGDKTRGHTLPAGNYFGLDVEQQGGSGGSLFVAWSSNEGESAGSLGAVVWDVFALEPLGPPVTPIAPTLPAMNHRVTAGVFFPSR